MQTSVGSIRILVYAFLSLAVSGPEASAGCNSFFASTMDVGGIQKATWRTDYPPAPASVDQPWLAHEFITSPRQYMDAVIAGVRPHFTYDGSRLVGTQGEPWWMSDWMDYGKAGREPVMGLTKERGPDAGDLSSGSAKGSQVWAVNFYNAPGAEVFGSIFSDPCNPAVPAQVLFPEGTVAIKFLFTDANLGIFKGQVPYLDGAPLFTAHIDREGVWWESETSKRVLRQLNLIQLDIAVKDSRANKTGWVFGTYVWMGPKDGDGLFDNLVPAVLMWANDEGNVTEKLSESWTNPDMAGVLYGWHERPYLGFKGRANGPADNIRSSCLSCHGAARAPLSSLGIVGRKFKLEDFGDESKVREHVDRWFANVGPGETFDPGGEPEAVAALDYSLQLGAAFRRMCQACADGGLSGATPAFCNSAGYFKAPVCPVGTLPSVLHNQGERSPEFLPRQ